MTLTAAQQTEIDKKVRSPRGLLKIVHTDGTIRISKGGDVTWNSQNFLKSGFKADQIKTGKGGIQTGRFTIINENYIYSVLASAGKLNFATVEYWEYYGSSPALDDPIKKFYGEVTRIPSMGAYIVLDCTTTGGVTKRIPHLQLGNPDVNHMPYAGQTIPIGNTIYTVEIN